LCASAALCEAATEALKRVTENKDLEVSAVPGQLVSSSVITIHET
jgi:hypothetical protein